MGAGRGKVRMIYPGDFAAGSRSKYLEVKMESKIRKWVVGWSIV